MAVQRRATAENGDIELDLSVTVKSPLVISTRAPEATPSRQRLDSAPMSPPLACSTLSTPTWRCATRSDYLHRLLGCDHAIDRHHRGDIDAKVIATTSKRQVTTCRAAVASRPRKDARRTPWLLLRAQAEPFGQSSCTCRKATNSSSANSSFETDRRSLASRRGRTSSKTDCVCLYLYVLRVHPTGRRSTSVCGPAQQETKRRQADLSPTKKTDCEKDPAAHENRHVHITLSATCCCCSCRTASFICSCDAACSSPC